MIPKTGVISKGQSSDAIMIAYHLQGTSLNRFFKDDTVTLGAQDKQHPDELSGYHAIFRPIFNLPNLEGTTKVV